MTLRIRTLTAVAALSISATGIALAQDTATTPPVEQPAEAQPATEPAETTPEATTEAPAAETDSEAAAGEATEEPAAEAAADEPAADEAAADEATADEAATDETAGDEPAAEAAPAEAPATEEAADAATDEPAAAEEPAAEEPAAEEAPAEEPAAEATATDEPAGEETAAEEPAAEEAAADEPAAEDAAAEEPAAEEPAAEEAATEEPAAEEAAGDDHAATEEHAAGGGDHGAGHIVNIAFSFEGPFGRYDQFQLQRGLQVYTEVCAACHGMKFVPIRTLHDDGGPGLPEDQVRAYAAAMTITDAETGDDRPRLPTDHFPTVSGDGMGPDLSLMAKARAGFHGPLGTGLSQLFNGIGGPEYIYSLLIGYSGEEIEQAGTVFYENSAFPGGYISMPSPLSDDLVTYEDGTPATVDQMSRDVAAFLMWTAEPKMMDRKMVGLVSVLFLIVLSALLYLTNKRIWAPHKGKKTTV